MTLDSTQISDTNTDLENEIDWEKEIEGDVEILPAAETVAEGAAAEETSSGEGTSVENAAPNAPTETVAVSVATEAVPVPAAAPAPAPAPETLKSQPIDTADWEAQQLDALAKIYGLNEEDAESLLTEPSAVMPKIAAQLHMNITKTVLASMQTVLPQIIAQHNVAEKTEHEAQNAFFTANQDLRGHEEAVLKIGQMFRAANPTADRATAIKVIGNMTRMALGLAVPNAAPALPASNPPTNVVKPFTPAVGSATPVSVNSNNQWEELL